MLTRRGFLAGLCLTSCSRREPAVESPREKEAVPPASATPDPLPPLPDEAAAPAPRGRVGTETWSFDAQGRAVVIVPSWTPPGPAGKWPVLIALHGRGEAQKGPERGVQGWPRDYALLRGIERISQPPLASADFESFVTVERLREMNDDLSARPYGGCVVVCPYMPDVDLRRPPQIREYAQYLTQVVVPRVRRELPVFGSAAATGIDGVSLGGAMALRAGLGAPDVFGCVGSLQAAIGEDQVLDFVLLAKSARTRSSTQKLRLLTSQEDYFRKAIAKTSSALRAAEVEHEFREVPGPHDYPFNRGPGALEMLYWHDRNLARQG